MIHAGIGTESSNYSLKDPTLPILPFFLLVMETSLLRLGWVVQPETRFHRPPCSQVLAM